jgi:hypothetical protein
MEMDKEAFLEWEAHPVTQAVKGLLASQVEECKARWAQGDFVGQPLQEAGILGRIGGYNAIINLEREELNYE